MSPSLSGPLYAASLARTALEYRGEVDVVLGSWAYPDGFAAVLLARMLGVPAVVKLHGSDINVVARLPGPRRALRWALPRAARVVAVSRPLAEHARELGAPVDRIDVVPNGIDRHRFHPRARAAARWELGLAAHEPLAVYVGNVEVHKGCADLVLAFAHAARRVAGAALAIVGDGPAMGECRRLARELGVRVSFPGRKPHDAVPDWIAAADVVVLPSWNEGTPNVVIEALASGRRVVATCVGGTPDLVTAPLLGVLVPPKDPTALGDAIAAALAEPYDPEAVHAAFDVPDWSESARRLHASLSAAIEDGARGREAA